MYGLSLRTFAAFTFPVCYQESSVPLSDGSIFVQKPQTVTCTDGISTRFMLKKPVAWNYPKNQPVDTTRYSSSGKLLNIVFVTQC